MKICTNPSCVSKGIPQELSQFNRDNRRPDGGRSRCKSCVKVTDNTYSQNNKHKRKQYREQTRDHIRKRNLMYIYGISEELARSIVSGSMSCAVCDAREDICIDHDHSTGIVRGVLCRRCNIALACMREDPELLERLKRYVEERK